MLIRKKEILKLSEDIRKIIDGKSIDLRENKEGAWGVLKNDIHTLANIRNEQFDVFQSERDSMADTLANISHQLKTPLTSLLIMADLLENAPPEKQADFIQNIKISLTNMDWLVSALLKMAKLDAKTISFSIISISSDLLLKTALKSLNILLDIKSQQVEFFNDTELLCDKRWTTEALTNILKNASEYSPVGAKIYVDSGSNPIYKWISVTDSGEGIKKDKISSLFKRFTESRSDHGYGIGLPLSYAIMRNQNGDIEVDGGGYGKGATFTLKFYQRLYD